MFYIYLVQAGVIQLLIDIEWHNTTCFYSVTQKTTIMIIIKEERNVCLYFVAFSVQNGITFINHYFIISVLLHNSTDQLINASVSDLLFNIQDVFTIIYFFTGNFELHFMNKQCKFQNIIPQNITVWYTFVHIHCYGVFHIHVYTFCIYLIHFN